MNLGTKRLMSKVSPQAITQEIHVHKEEMVEVSTESTRKNEEDEDEEDE